jgi:FixJ family two-component response regulator
MQVNDAADKAPPITGRVVVIEDDENVRRSLTMVLRARGFAVEVYRSGIELLSNRTPIDAHCMIIDYKMPRIDGLTLLERLREAGNATPALMMTGFFSSTLRERALSVGYDDVLEKPMQGPTLLSWITETIKKAA